MRRGIPYIPHGPGDISRMLKAVGAQSVEELLKFLPENERKNAPLNVPDGLSEQDIKALMEGLGGENTPVSEAASFLGAGAYNHYIPAAVDQLLLRSEFYTAYTPYQPEISQGTLQAIFEFQTLICQLTGAEISNASLYDGASAAAEAALMARRLTNKRRVVISSALHPEYRETIKTYLGASGEGLTELSFDKASGVTAIEAAEASLDASTACLIIQSPNFFGSIEDIRALADAAHKKGALLVVVVTEPVSFGLLKPPAELGADIIVGEGQSFGNQLNFGGPYLGFIGARAEYIRQMPGRMAGETVDKEGRRAFCLTLATREQHIRRERATSNICTNEALSALAFSIHAALLGKEGLTGLSRLNLSKARYLRESLLKVPGISAAFTAPSFNEFVIKVPSDPERFLKALLRKNIVGGLSLKRFYPALENHILVTATEMNSREQIEAYAEAAGKALSA